MKFLSPSGNTGHFCVLPSVIKKYQFYINFSVPGEPTNVQATILNSSSVQVSWDPPVDKDQNGIIRGYQIHVQPKNVVCVLHSAFFLRRSAKYQVFLISF
jgi:hypothetical protein